VGWGINKSVPRFSRRDGGFFCLLVRCMKYKFFIFLCFSLLMSSANALQKITGKVTSLEATYMPAWMIFVMDVGNSTCPTGNMLKWQKSDLDNNKIVYSTLLAALASGKRMEIFINDGDSTCLVQFIHIING